MNMRYLKTFAAVAEARSFTEAAQRLGLTQSAVSLQIQKLEREFRAQLLERTRQPVALTPAGEALLEKSEIILAAYGEALEAVQSSSLEIRGKLVVAASTIPGEYFLPRLLADFVRGNAAVSVELAVGDTGDVYRRLTLGDVTFGFVGARRDDMPFKHEAFALDEIVLIGPRGAPGSIGTVFELAALPLIVREEGSGTWSTAAGILAGSGVDVGRIHPVMTVGSTHAVLEAVRRGAGYGFVSRVAAADFVERSHVVEVVVPELELRRTLWAVFNPGRVRGALRTAFAEFLESGHGRWDTLLAGE